MNTRRNVAQRVEEEITNAGAPPHGEQVPPLEEDDNIDQSPADPPPLKDGDISDALIQLSQDSTIKYQAMTAKPNRELVPILFN